VKESFALLAHWIRNVHLHELSDETYPFRELFKLLLQSGSNRYTLAEVAEQRAGALHAKLQDVVDRTEAVVRLTAGASPVAIPSRGPRTGRGNCA